jgi:signal transduction histidine kinase
MPEDHADLERIRAAERLRIAQELHDSTSQLLAVLQLTLGRMRRHGIAELEPNIAECEDIVAEVGRQMREIGHPAHTPAMQIETVRTSSKLDCR